MRQKFEVEIESIRKFSESNILFALQYAILAPPKRKIKVRELKL